MSNDEANDKIRQGFGFGGLAKSLREQADQIGKSAKDAVNKAQQNAENLTHRVDQSVNLSSTLSGGDRVGIESSGSGTQRLAESGPKKVSGSDITPDDGASLASRSPEEVSKEELLDILQKMNKRVKALSALRVTLTDRVKSSEKDRSRLVEFLKNEVLTPADVEEASVEAAKKNEQIAEKQAESANTDNVYPSLHKIDEIGMLQMAWRAVDERNSLSLQAIQSEYKNLTLQHQSELEKLQEAVRQGRRAEMDGVALEIDAGSADPCLAETTSKQKEKIAQMQKDHQSEIDRIQQKFEERYLSLEDHEAKIKEAKLDTAKQVKEAYEKKLAVIKEKAKTFVEKTKRESAEQLAAARKEAAEIKMSKDQPEVESIPKVNSEVLSLREKLEATQASQTEATAELVQVKGALSETTALLEQSKEKEEATAAELEGIRAEAAEAAKAAEMAQAAEAAALASAASATQAAQESEASLKQRLKDEVEGQQAQHEEAMQSLQARHQEEIADMKGKYDELVSSTGKEKDGEVVALRKQLDDLQASFEATQASQTEATAELVQVKGALSESTALLEQSKEKEEATAAELEGIRAEAAEAAKAAEIAQAAEAAALASAASATQAAQESEASLKQRLKDEVEGQQAQHEEAMQSLQARHQEEIADMKGKYDELVSSTGKEKDGEVVALRKQLDDLQASFEATQASQTEATAELVQVKGALSETTALLEQSKEKEEATAAELEGIRAEAAEAAKAAEMAQAAEAAALASAASATQAAQESEASLKQRLKDEVEGQQAQHEEAMQSLQARHQEEIADMKGKYDELVSSTGKEKDEEVVALRKQLDDLQASFEATQASQTEATAELVQVKGALSETTALLEQSKEKEEATAAELEGIRAEAAEAAKAAEMAQAAEAAALASAASATQAAQESEASLKQRLKDEVEGQQAQHEEAMQSLQARHQEEIADMKGKYDELVSSTGKEKDGEVVALRKQLDDLQASFEATQASQTEATAELVQVKGALSETTALLEQSKEKEEATAAELEGIRAEAAEAAKAAEMAQAAEAAALASAASATQAAQESEASLKQRLKDEVEGQQAQHEEAMQSLQARHQEEIADMKGKYDELVSSTGKEKDEEVVALRKQLDDLQASFEVEREKILSDSQGKLNVLSEKHTKALDYIKKLKAATADKLKQISEDRTSERVQFEEEKSQLKNELGSESLELKKVIVGLEEQLSKVKEKCDLAEAHKKLSEQDVEARISLSLEELESKHQTALEALAEEKRKSIGDLKAHHLEALEAVRGEKQTEIEELKASFNERLKASTEESAKAQADLEEKMANHADDLKSFYDGKLKDAVVERETSNQALSSLRGENDSLRAQLMEESTVNKEMKQKIRDLKEEMTVKSSNSAATVESLMKQQALLEGGTKDLKEKISSMIEDKQLDVQALDSLRLQVQNLTTKVETLKGEKNDLEERVQIAARKANKLSVTEAELSSLREEVNKLKLTESKSSGLVVRLQSEKEASERKHGQQTALIGMLEAQLAELNENNNEIQAKLEATLYDSRQKDETIVAIKDQLEKSETALAQQASKKVQNESFTQHAIDKESAKKGKMIEALQKEVQSLQQQMARKSSAAQRLLQQREAECNELRKTNKVLQNEVDKGSLSDRRIFELAAQQSNRESVAAAEIELRDKLVQRLAEKLESRDSELASAEYTVQKVEGQVEELCRVQRREDVNLDYLKSIVVQYLSKPPGSSERAALLPVLATLLQFDASDYEAIEAGKASLSWWGSIIPKEIAAPSLPPTPAPSSRPTNLQF